MRFEFTIPGKPTAWQRARQSKNKHTGKPVFYTDDKTQSSKDMVAWLAKQAGAKVVRGGVVMEVEAVFDMPKKWSKRTRIEMYGKPYIIKPDTDNIIKLIKDALNKIAYVDDCQVYDEHPVKRYIREGEIAHTRVAIREG